MARSSRALVLGAAVALSLLPPTARTFAGGPLRNCRSGQPYLWPGGGANIPYNLDLGFLGPLTGPQVRTQTDQALRNWQSVPTSTIGFDNAGSLSIDVDSTNFGPFFQPSEPDGISPIVYDADGSIFRLLFGTASGILGFAGPEWVNPSTCEILEGRAFFNGGAMLFGGFPRSEFLSVQHHEFGHYVNLGHTVVNGQIPEEFLGDTTGPTPFDTFPRENLFMRIETMYPFIFVGGGQDTPHADDIATVSTLYPDPSFFSGTGSISGTVIAPNRITSLTGVNVIARNTANPFDDAVSAISGDLADPLSPSDPFTGFYTLNGLTPGAEYAVYLDQILAGGFGTQLIILPGEEEFYSGEAESNGVSSPDDPSRFEPVISAAGVRTSGIDIIMNGIPPGPIPLSNNDSREIFLPWRFGFCGIDYDSLFVGSNGNITFGVRDVDSTESIEEFLSGPPRIAGLWDDLNPDGAGAVFYGFTGHEFTVTYAGLPESPLTGSNSFEIVLHRASDQVELRFGSVSALDGLSGISCGGRVTTGREDEVDLDRVARTGDGLGPRGVPALFERFSTLENPRDLEEGDTLRFNAPNAFKDTGEPNDSTVKATRVNLPFDSSGRFTAIEPPGEDVDRFRFRAEKGKTLIARVTAGNLDTLIGLFDADGILIASDDDDGPGLLSLLGVEIPHDGEFSLAVTTFPDFEFEGAGDTAGRFILEILSIEGDLLILGDNDSREVPFEDFLFPFQGRDWASVFVNSNGNLTFDRGDPTFRESVAGFLNGPPRIAPLWDDLVPDQGGMVVVDRTPDSFTVSFIDVPEILSDTGNNFTVTLQATGEIELSYSSTAGNDGIVGVTGGDFSPNPGLTDLSKSAALPALGTTYEQFGPGGFDLDGLRLLFIP